MAPRVQRDYYNSGDPNRYALRTLKHCEDNFLQLRNVDVSKINGKEDFFRCIGLQMRKFQYQYRTPNGDHGIKKINIPRAVMLRDCCVVILGSTCVTCGVCFKCETDLNVHVELKHRIDKSIHHTAVKQTQCTETENELVKSSQQNFVHTTIVADKNFGTKLQKKLRLTLRIGEEVVAKMSMKRKHLMTNKVDMCTQTELSNSNELAISEDVRKSIVCGIDPPILSNSLSQCCNPTMCRVNSQNRYLATSIVADKQPLNEKSIAQEENNPLNNLNKLCGTRINEKYCAVPTTTLLPDLPGDVDSENCSSDTISSVHTKNVSMHYDSSQFSNNRRTFFDINENHCKTLTKSTGGPLETTRQTNQRRCNRLNKVKDINGNEVQNDIYVSEKERQSQSACNMVQLVMPMILPIIMPNESNLSAPIKLTIQSASLQKQQDLENRQHFNQEQQNRYQRPQEQQNQHPQLQDQQRQQLQYSEQEKQQQIQRWQQEQQLENVQSSTREGANDDEIQEVLRIVRGRNISTEINHESPSRVEQAMLVEGAIRDMNRVEQEDEEDCHVLEKEVMEPVKKKIRCTKSGIKNASTNVECNKGNRESIIRLNSACNIERSTIGDTCISNTKEHIAKVQNYSATMTACAKDNTKENFSCNRNINIPSEVLRGNNITYYNGVFEINNNTENMQQESVSRHFLVPCSGGMENRGNRPAVIDLVSDTDE